MSTTLKVLVLGAWAVCTLGVAPGALAAKRVLPPSAAAHVKRALSSDESLRFDGASLNRDTVVVTLCDSSADCFQLTMSDPRAGCDHHHLPAWCVRVTDGDPDEASLNRALSSLRTVSADSVWTEPAPMTASPGDEPAEALAPEAPESSLPAVALAFLLLLVPLIVGWRTGGMIARRLVSHRGKVAALSLFAAGTVATTLMVSQHAPRLSPYDLMFGWLLFLVALVPSALRHDATRTPWAGIASAALSLLLAFGIAEAWAAGQTIPAPAVPPPAELTLQAPVGRPCHRLFPKPSLAAWAAAELAERKERPVVLHVGDSMVDNQHLRSDERLIHVLRESDRAYHHVNASVGSTGTDHQLAMARRTISAVRPAVVVHHLFVGNDLDDIGLGWACCSGEAPVDLTEPGFPDRCVEPSWSAPLPILLRTRPAPYVLRVAANWSSFAHLLAWNFVSRVIGLTTPRRDAYDIMTPLAHEHDTLRRELERVAESPDGPDPDDPLVQRFLEVWRLSMAIRDAAEAGGARYALHVMPYRNELRPPTAERKVSLLRAAFRTAAASSAVLHLDVSDVIASAAEVEGFDIVFFGDGGDYHFSRRGNELLSEHLVPFCQAALAVEH